MTSGTKIFLAVFALFIGILVVYYGVLMPGGAPAPAVAETMRKVNGPQSEALTDHHLAATQELPQTESAAEPELPSASPVDVDQARANASASGSTPSISMDNRAKAQESPPGALPLNHSDRLAMRDRQSQRAALPRTTPGAPVTSRPQANPIAPVQIEPKPAAPAPSAPQSQETTEYIVKSGDSMWTIAESWYGDRSKWTLIAKANPLADPARMQIGDKLKLPPKEAAIEKPAPPKTPETPKNPPSPDDLIYTVKPGDTLAKIARDLYGEFYIWETIYELNKDVIGDDPAALSLDMKLKLPKPPTKKSG